MTNLKMTNLKMTNLHIHNRVRFSDTVTVYHIKPSYDPRFRSLYFQTDLEFELAKARRKYEHLYESTINDQDILERIENYILKKYSTYDSDDEEYVINESLHADDPSNQPYMMSILTGFFSSGLSLFFSSFFWCVDMYGT